MNEEENSFDRPNEESHDASELHSFGGIKDESPEETKTENEELANAIEELESNEVEASAPEVKEEPVFKSEPVKKEEPVMTIDSVKEPKEKKCGGAGWKLATFLFAVLAILGCGAACYLFFSDGTTKFLGREVSSKSEAAKKNDNPSKPSDAPISDTTLSTRYIYLDGYDYAIKVPDTLTYLSFDYHQFNMGDSESSTYEGNFSTLSINAAVTGVDHQSAPEFIEDGLENEFVSLGSITIGRVNPIFKDNNVLGEPILTGLGSDGGRNLYFSGPQQAYSQSDWSRTWEEKTVAEIEKWLTNKDSYIKIK